MALTTASSLLRFTAAMTASVSYLSLACFAALAACRAAPVPTDAATDAADVASSTHDAHDARDAQGQLEDSDASDDAPAADAADVTALPCDGACDAGSDCVADACVLREWAQPIDPAMIDGVVETTDAAMLVVGRVTAGPFRHGPVTLPRAAPGFTNVFVARWSRGGRTEAASVIVTAVGAPTVRVAPWSDGGALVAFDLDGPATFGAVTLTPVGARDVVVLKLDRSLAVTAALQLGGDGAQSLTNLVARAETAVLSLTTNVATTLATTPVPEGSALVTIDAALTATRVRGFAARSASGSARVGARAIDSRGNVSCAASLDGTYDFGNGALTAPTPSVAWLLLDPALETRGSSALTHSCAAGSAVRDLAIAALETDAVAITLAPWCATQLGPNALAHRGLQDVHGYFASSDRTALGARSLSGAGVDQSAGAIATRGGALFAVSVDGARGADFGGGTVTAPLRALVLVRTSETSAYLGHRVINDRGSTQVLYAASASSDAVLLVLSTDVSDTILGTSVSVAGEFGRTVVARAAAR